MKKPLKILKKRIDKMKKLRLYISFLLALALMVACQSSRPDYVLDDDDMGELLYDIHRAHFLYRNQETGGDDGAHQYALFLKVLQKHKVSEAVWDSSMVYYCAHADELQEIYKDLTERLEHEAEAIGVSTTNADDSVNIWQGDRSIVLTAYQPYTTKQWTIKTDSLVKPGERLTLRFTSLFLQPNKEMRAACVMAIKLSNDSVVTTNQTLSRTGIYNLSLADNEAMGIKEIKGLFMMYPENNMGMGYQQSERRTSQILCVKDIVLLHEKQGNVSAPERNEPTPSQSDTLQSHTLGPEHLKEPTMLGTRRMLIEKQQ